MYGITWISFVYKDNLLDNTHIAWICDTVIHGENYVNFKTYCHAVEIPSKKIPSPARTASKMCDVCTLS